MAGRMGDTGIIIDLRRRHLDAMMRLRRGTNALHHTLLPHVFRAEGDAAVETKMRKGLRAYLPHWWPWYQRHGEAIGLERDGLLLGYVLFSYFNLPEDELLHGRHGLFVHDIAVDPGHRRQGIGRTMLDEVARRARALGEPVQIHASIWSGNAPSEALFSGMGFQPLNRSFALFLEPEASEVGDVA